MRKTIVVTGASGFLGSHFLSMLKDDERYSLAALSSRSAELKSKIGGNNIAYCDKDAIYAPDAERFFPNAIVVNCAFPRNATGTGMADGLKYIQQVFEAASKYGAKAIINISSQSVYSQQRAEAAKEDSPICLESPYAVGKYATELMLESICRGTKTKYTNLRMASLIGPGFDQRIVNRFVRQALETGKLTVKRNQQRFGFFDIEDAAGGLAAMLDADVAVWKPVYNLGREGAFTLVEIAELIRQSFKEACGAELSIEVENGDEKSNTDLNADAFRRDFSFQQSFSLQDSIMKILSYCKN